MKLVMFYHSLYSDWNHGNAHFLRGIVREFKNKNYDVQVYEPQNGWSLENLIQDHGAEKLQELKEYYPGLETNYYDPAEPDLTTALEGADYVIVHEWNDKNLIKTIGEQKKTQGFRLLFHDTHHRAVSDPESLDEIDLSNYDGALVFGDIIKKIYEEKKWAKQIWTWHEAADTVLFKPNRDEDKEGDLVWIGNWGDDEREDELMEFLINPVKELGIKAKVYGVRYPKHAIKALEDAGIEYGGWLPNYKVPEIFSKYKLTVHVPRRPYVEMLPGIPTIRPFEALACGIPLISAPWKDVEGLFTSGKDYLMVKNGDEMAYRISEVIKSAQLAGSLSENGVEVIKEKHTCVHRVDELEKIFNEIGEKMVSPRDN
ncbi:glycosyltransferase [Salegentibacter salinarum]|uniref:Glycosyltransferase n=1 Tax=Salegentibacter salinarum TaxID=447422 RepID=A0A2N0TN91_9FLAO|nr:glycosyltransferase [Salegentibacter salinarum]PKD16211.1 glycosyltransferase [Salegentibacter salinarum]SKB67864.1 Spore maturation protein CgeB [Salegentibacter salinarum]